MESVTIYNYLKKTKKKQPHTRELIKTFNGSSNDVHTMKKQTSD